MPRRLRALVALLLAAVPAAAHAGTVIDSYTHALPPNFFLPVTHRPILFLGSLCDGVLCPPASLVTYPADIAVEDQSAVPGTISPWRSTILARQFTSGPPDQGVLRIDPASGGSLRIEGASGAGLIAIQLWGDDTHPLNLDLSADGSDHFEIEIVGAPNEELLLEISLYNASANVWVSRQWVLSGPGTISVLYEGITGLEPIVHDIDRIDLRFFIPSGTPLPLVVGEFRTAGTPSPAQPETWGRIKDAYRR